MNDQTQTQEAWYDSLKTKNYDPKSWDWYMDACECYDRGLPNPPIDVNHPYTAMTRGRLHPEGPYVAIFWYYGGKTGKLYMKLDGNPVDPDAKRANSGQLWRELWPFFSKMPVRKDPWDHYAKHGRWPEIPDAVYEFNKPTPQPPTNSQAMSAPPEMEKAPDDADFETFKAKVMKLINAANQALEQAPAKNEREAQAATALRNVLLETSKLQSKDKLARDPRVTSEIKDGYAKYTAYFREWKDLLDLTTIYSALNSHYIGPWLKAEREKDEKRIKETGVSSQPKNSVGGAGTTVGRAAHLVPVKTAIITDYNAAWAHFKTNDKVQELIQTLANAMARGGNSGPGWTVHTDYRAQ